MTLDRRKFLLSAAVAASAFPAAIARALEIPAKSTTGTVRDVEHVVILTQENRSFDHYFGTLRGVRGFSDRFAPPAPANGPRQNHTVLVQIDEHDDSRLIAPFRLDTTADFHAMRTEGTPHTFPDAHAAWNGGRMDAWPQAKHNRSMGYFTRDDIPFQFALAEAFTLCDAYHCALHAGTNPNRTVLWTGTNDGDGKQGGPVIDNGYDELSGDPKHHGGYSWTTYPERLSAAGISWQVYQDMDDNFTDNSLVGFKTYRAADKAKDGPLADLARRSIRTRNLDQLKQDVLAGTLPQVSWIVATAEGSEHPGPSSPAQGADYTAAVLDALTANPKVWASTVLLINFDENDGFFDHVPPPAPPSHLGDVKLGDSQIDTGGEYYSGDGPWHGQPYGLGPRVPMYVVSPWSKGGFVNSQVFDHTSVIRFLETRFGVQEPNISPWRRAVCGDLLSCFDFANPNPAAAALPATQTTAKRTKALTGTVNPPPPGTLTAPVQEPGQRPARSLPYVLSANPVADGWLTSVELKNESLDTAAVFHLYSATPGVVSPLRLTVAAGSQAMASIPSEDGMADFHVLGPNGFYRRFSRSGTVDLTISLSGTTLSLANPSGKPVTIALKDESYGQATQTVDLLAGQSKTLALDLSASHNWYDFSLTGPTFFARFAGHVENGRPSKSDPAFGGPAPLTLPPINAF